MLIGVYFIQNLIQNLDQVMNGVVWLFQNSSGFGIMLVISAASLLFGLTTGLSLVPIGIILPLVATLPMDPTLKLLYTFFVFIWSFYGLLLLSAASVPAFDCQVHGMCHLAGLQRTFENHSLAVCILFTYYFICISGFCCKNTI